MTTEATQHSANVDTEGYDPELAYNRRDVKETKGILRRDGNYDPHIPVFMQVPKKVKISHEKGAFVEDQTKEDE